MPQFWDNRNPAPTDEEFIYISGPDKQGNRFVSKAKWQNADEDHGDRYYDRDMGDEADIAGWLLMPKFRTEPEKET